jgi:outer membrane protein TolC
MKFNYLFILYIWSASWVMAQGVADSLPVMPLTQFLNNIKLEHPLARNADLLLRQAEAQVRQARGAFDPKLFSDWQQKSFDGKNYYRVGEMGAKVTTLFGPEIKSSFNTAGGNFLNSADQLPDPGQALLGLTVPLLNGLFFDPNRAGLQVAQLDRDGLAAERRALLNDLLLQAGITYINWSVAYNQLRITEQAYQLSLVRFRGIRESYFVGDKPAVDTIETFTQVQTWQLELNDALVAFRNANLSMQALRWEQGRAPSATTPWNWRPDELNQLVQLPAIPVDSFTRSLELLHPDLRRLQVDLRQLEVDRRLAAEQFKPRLDLSYNLLARGFDFTPTNKEGVPITLTEALSGNFKWGLNFSFPLFLRKERGKMELIQVKQLQTTNKFDQKRIEIENKVRNYFNDYENSLNQIQRYQTLVRNLQALLQAEQRKFEAGESSIFLINSREQKLIETQLKFNKLQGEFAKNLLSVYWAAGRLPASF